MTQILQKLWQIFVCYSSSEPWSSRFVFIRHSLHTLHKNKLATNHRKTRRIYRVCHTRHKMQTNEDNNKKTIHIKTISITLAVHIKVLVFESSRVSFSLFLGVAVPWHTRTNWWNTAKRAVRRTNRRTEVGEWTLILVLFAIDFINAVTPFTWRCEYVCQDDLIKV